MTEPLPVPVDLQAILISLHVDGRQALVVLLAADGSINRLGTGKPGESESTLFIGATDPAAFRSLASQVDSSWFRYSGQQFELPDRRGAPCTLRLILKNANDEHVFEFLYGAASQGPPADIGRFVAAAVELTDPWYEAQTRIARHAERPWWRFW